MFSILNPSNAFVIKYFKKSDTTVILDPWITTGIYDGGWTTYPPINQSINQSGHTHVLITHLHKDHFDIDYLKQFNDSTKFYTVKTFGYQIIEKQLENIGRTCQVIGLEETIELEDEISVTAVPPLNTTLLEAKNENKSTFIDGGFLIQKSGYKFLFLADNNLYDLEEVQRLSELLNKVDLLAVGYSGFASDYPFNYDFSLDDKIHISNELEEKRFQLQAQAIKMINPKYLMPYSSDFAPMGKNALLWAEMAEEIWTSSKEKVVQRYQDFCNIETLLFYQDTEMKFENGYFTTTHKGKPFIMGVSEYVKKISSHNSIPLNELFVLGDVSITLIQECFENYKKSVNKFNLHPEFNILIETETPSGINKLVIKNESPEIIILDHDSEYFLDELEPYIHIKLECDYLYALLTRQTNWNDASLSFRLLWSRKPNYFCNDSYTALIWFTLPIDKVPFDDFEFSEK